MSGEARSASLAPSTLKAANEGGWDEQLLGGIATSASAPSTAVEGSRATQGPQ
jgi:hypothetical protein